MTLEADRIDRPTEDPVSNVLKWVLLVVAVVSFAILGWTTKLTYEAAPPFPDRFVTSGGAVLMTAADIRRQGGLSESRSDGLRQPLRHGVVFRGGLHGRHILFASPR